MTLINLPEAAIQRLDESHLPQIVDVYYEAFKNYPVMKFIIGSAGDDYDIHLRLLIELFVTKRLMRGGPVLGIATDGNLVACASVTPPQKKNADERLKDIEKTIWGKLHQEAQNRYEALCKLWDGFKVEDPHYHINMIGVRSSYKSQGLGSKLLKEVHQMSSDDSDSCGVTLTTEDPANVSFYQRHGYNLEGHFIFSEALESWCFFRPI